MQSRGIGKILLDYIKDKKDRLQLKVYQKNVRAMSFYQREGFTIQSEGMDEFTGEKEICDELGNRLEFEYPWLGRGSNRLVCFTRWKMIPIGCSSFAARIPKRFFTRSKNI